MTATAAEPMNESLPEPTLESELWFSFVSLLRSYTAAAGLNLDAMPHVEEAENSVAIVATGVRTEMQFDPATRRVEFQMRNDVGTLLTSGSFEILLDGTIEIGGTTKDLDHAAIDFVQLALDPGFVSGHDFSRAETTSQKAMALAPEALKGHGFSRAETAPRKEGALAPEGSPSQIGREKP